MNQPLATSIGCTLKEDQPRGLLFNLFFYHVNRSEPTYRSQCIKLLDVIAVCNQLNVIALNYILLTIFSYNFEINMWKGPLIFGEISKIVSY